MGTAAPHLGRQRVVKRPTKIRQGNLESTAAILVDLLQFWVFTKWKFSLNLLFSQ